MIEHLRAPRLCAVPILLLFAASLCLAMTGPSHGEAPAVRPILIGLDADITAQRAGEAIRRGIVLAIDEINGAGSVLGRRLELVVRDYRGNPARGIDNIEELATLDDPPFADDRHDALDAADFRLSRYGYGAIIPLPLR